jgi:hypothetical protein
MAASGTAAGGQAAGGKAAGGTAAGGGAGGGTAAGDKAAWSLLAGDSEGAGHGLTPRAGPRGGLRHVHPGGPMGRGRLGPLPLLAGSIPSELLIFSPLIWYGFSLDSEGAQTDDF